MDITTLEGSRDSSVVRRRRRRSCSLGLVNEERDVASSRRSCSLSWIEVELKSGMTMVHGHDYHDGCRKDLEIGGIVLALVAMVHIEVHLGSSSSSAPSAAASTSSTPYQCTTHRLRRAYKDRHPRH
jgi:hypothetical protein